MLTCAECLSRKGECDGECARKPTNADLIRSMTDEELARWIADDLIEPGYYKGDQCYRIWLDWLKQEVNDEN